MKIDDEAYLKAAVDIFGSIKGRELVMSRNRGEVPTDSAAVVVTIAKALKAGLSEEQSAE